MVTLGKKKQERKKERKKERERKQYIYHLHTHTHTHTHTHLQTDMAGDVFVHLVDVVIQVWLVGLVLLPTRAAVTAPPTPASHPTRFRGGLHTGALGYTTPHPSRLQEK